MKADHVRCSGERVNEEIKVLEIAEEAEIER